MAANTDDLEDRRILTETLHDIVALAVGISEELPFSGG